jgi:hypothetical protein
MVVVAVTGTISTVFTTTVVMLDAASRMVDVLVTVLVIWALIVWVVVALMVDTGILRHEQALETAAEANLVRYGGTLTLRSSTLRLIGEPPAVRTVTVVVGVVVTVVMLLACSVIVATVVVTVPVISVESTELTFVVV